MLSPLRGPWHDLGVVGAWHGERGDAAGPRRSPWTWTGAPGQHSQPGAPLSSSVRMLICLAGLHQLALCFYSSFLDICNICFCVLHCQKSWGNPVPILEGDLLKVSIHQSIAVPRCSHILGAGYPSLPFQMAPSSPTCTCQHGCIEFLGTVQTGLPLTPTKTWFSSASDIIIYTSRGNHHEKYIEN